MYIRNITGLRALEAGYQTDYDATLAQYQTARGIDPFTSGVELVSSERYFNLPPIAQIENSNPVKPVNGDWVPLPGAQSFVTNYLASGVNPNAGNDAVCPQVMKRCADGSQVGYDLKVKDRCVYLPCPTSKPIVTVGGSSGSNIDTDTGTSLMPSWLDGVSLPVLLGGAAVLAFVLFRK